MFIAIIQDKEVENELDIQWHCKECAKTTYGWSENQYLFVQELILNNKPISVPLDIDTPLKFGNYIKSLKL